MTDKWLTIDQIADYLQVSKEKIYKLCQKGKMPASKFGGQWRFKMQVVDRWMLKDQAVKKKPNRKPQKA
jgi:excisionase family DNA binding protein